MKKSFILLTACLFSILTCYSQSVDRDNVKFVGLQFPAHPFIDASSYSVSLDAQEEVLNNMETVLYNVSAAEREELLAVKQLNTYLNPYPNILSHYLFAQGSDHKAANGDVKIEMKIDEVQISGRTLQELERECGTKDNPKVCKSFVYEIKFKMGANYSVRDKLGQVMDTKVLRYPNTEYSAIFGNNSWGSFESREALDEGYSTKSDVFLKALYTSAALQVTIDAARYIEKNSFHVQVNETVMLASAKKKYNYSNLNQARQKAVYGFNALNGRMPNDMNYSQWKQAIDLWEYELLELDVSNKKARINANIGSAINYNIAVVYLYMFEFDKALEYTKKGREIGKMSSNLKSLEKEINRMSTLWETSSAFDKGQFDEISIPLDKSISKKKTPSINKIMEIAKGPLENPGNNKAIKPTTPIAMAVMLEEKPADRSSGHVSTKHQEPSAHSEAATVSVAGTVAVVATDIDDEYFFNKSTVDMLDARFEQMEQEYFGNVQSDPSTLFYFICVDENGKEKMIETDAILNSGYQADPSRRGFQKAFANIRKEGVSFSAALDMVIPHPFKVDQQNVGHTFPLRATTTDTSSDEEYASKYLEDSPENPEEDRSGLMKIESVEMTESLNVFGKMEKTKVVTCKYVVKVANEKTKEESILYGIFAAKVK